MVMSRYHDIPQRNVLSRYMQSNFSTIIFSVVDVRDVLTLNLWSLTFSG